MPEPVSTPWSARHAARDLMSRINRTWLEGRPSDLFALLHPNVVMVYPGFTGRAEGRDAFVEGFVDFCRNARVHSFDESEHQVDAAGQGAVISYRFTMVYERDGQRYRSAGRDLWVFSREEAEWLATWRTMFDVTEEPAEM